MEKKAEIIEDKSTKKYEFRSYGITETSELFKHFEEFMTEHPGYIHIKMKIHSGNVKYILNWEGATKDES